MRDVWDALRFSGWRHDLFSLRWRDTVVRACKCQDPEIEPQILNARKKKNLRCCSLVFLPSDHFSLFAPVYRNVVYIFNFAYPLCFSVNRLSLFT